MSSHVPDKDTAGTRSAAQNRMPIHPQSVEECVELLRWRADMGRRSGFEGSFASLSPYTQATLFGIAGELEHIADFLEGLDREAGCG